MIEIKKYEKNPVIRPQDVKPSHPDYQILGAFNPGAAIYKDEVILLLRVAERCVSIKGKVKIPVYKFEKDRSYPGVKEFDINDPDVKLKDTRGVIYKEKIFLSSMSHIHLARSKDGYNFTIDEKPFIFPVDESEEYGCEDARVTFINGQYYINFTVVSEDSLATKLAVTRDFKTLERKGIIFHPENKDVAIFPEKVKDKYIALHRPHNSGFGKPSIWYSESPDLLHWGNHKCILQPRNTRYESEKIGGGAPPIKTDQGWLVIYHGKGDNQLYSLFCLLLDLDDPTRIIRQAEKPLMLPSEDFELKGFFGNVVFTNGLVEKDNKIFIYYGAADESVGLAVTDTEYLLSSF